MSQLRKRLGLDPTEARAIADLKAQNLELVHLLNDTLNMINSDCSSGRRYETLTEWVIEKRNEIDGRRHQHALAAEYRRQHTNNTTAVMPAQIVPSNPNDPVVKRLLYFADNPADIEATQLAGEIVLAPMDSWVRPTKRVPGTPFPMLPLNFRDWRAEEWSAWFRWMAHDALRVRAVRELVRENKMDHIL